MKFWIYNNVKMLFITVLFTRIGHVRFDGKFWNTPYTTIQVRGDFHENVEWLAQQIKDQLYHICEDYSMGSMHTRNVMITLNGVDPKVHCISFFNYKKHDAEIHAEIDFLNI